MESTTGLSFQTPMAAQTSTRRQDGAADAPDAEAHRMGRKHAVVLFDGVCNLCNGSVNFIIARDPTGYFRFASLQSAVARDFLGEAGLPQTYLDSIVLCEDGVLYRHSDAVLRIARHLSGGWPLLYGFRVLPRGLRDRVYNWVARHRYR